MTSREQFEEVAANKLNFSVSTVIASRMGGSYDSNILDTWWYLWQESRETVEVELPAWFVRGAIAVFDRDEVEEAMSAAGIKVKGK